MAKFEIVSKYENNSLKLPVRATKHSAGYDFEVASNTVIPSYPFLQGTLKGIMEDNNKAVSYSLNEISDYTKITKAKPTLVPTGIKCKLADDEYLEISVRSSCPLKYWLILANGVGIIDSDYYNNPDNEGEIFFQIINLNPFPVLLQKGDKIGQGIIRKYIVTEDDAAAGDRLGGFGSTTLQRGDAAIQK